MADTHAGGPILIGFAGGGSSGVVFGRLMEMLAERGRRMIAFDMPGHTPSGLLGSDTPPRSLLTRAGPRRRRAISAFMVERWAGRSGQPVELLSHSAGMVDLARLPRTLDERVARFWITGAGMPGLAAMREANHAASEVRAGDSPSLWRMLLTRQVPTGQPRIHFGPADQRRATDAELAAYQGNEHIGHVLALLSERVVTRADWTRRRVSIVSCEGDAIAPPRRGALLLDRLRALGVAEAEQRVLHFPRPHMFISFEDSGAALADLLSAGPPSA